MHDATAVFAVINDGIVSGHGNLRKNGESSFGSYCLLYGPFASMGKFFRGRSAEFEGMRKNEEVGGDCRDVAR